MPRPSHTSGAQPDSNVGRLELESRVLYSLMLPVVRLARWCRFPLDRVVELLTLAYVEELRRHGMTLKEASEVLGKSLRTVAGISSRLRDDFLAAEEVHGLPRQVEYHVTLEARTVSELLEALAEAGQVVERQQVEEALEVLASEGRIVRLERDDGRTAWVVSQRYVDLVRQDNLPRRIDALNDLGEKVLRTVVSRFFEGDEDAFARTVTFAASREGIRALRKELHDRLRLGASDLEEAAAEEGESGRYAVVLCVTPVTPD